MSNVIQFKLVSKPSELEALQIRFINAKAAVMDARQQAHESGVYNAEAFGELVRAYDKAYKALQKYDDRPQAEVYEHPVAKRRRLTHGLRATMLVALIQRNSEVSAGRIDSPRYQKLSEQIEQLELRIGLIERAPVKKRVNQR